MRRKNKAPAWHRDTPHFAQGTPAILARRYLHEAVETEDDPVEGATPLDPNAPKPAADYVPPAPSRRLADDSTNK